MPAQVSTSGRRPLGCASSRNRPLRSSQSRSTSAGVIDGSPMASLERPQSTLVATSQSTGRPAARIRRASQPQAPRAGDEHRKARASVRAPAPDRVELRRGVEPRLVRLDQPEQPVALEVAVREEPLVVPGDARLRGRVADRDAPGPGQERRLDRRRHRRRAPVDVVVGAPLERDRVVPEDHVADEPVLARRAQQRLELRARALGLEPAPDDRREARVPVPLPRVAGRARPRVAVRARRRARPRPSSR